MDHLIDVADIFTITGLNDEEEIESYIPYAEAQASEMLGFLNKETRTHEAYIADTTQLIQLDFYPINNISSITYKLSAAGETFTRDSSEYRALLSKGQIIFDTPIYEDSTLYIDYGIGWDQSDVTELVKLFLAVLVAEQYYSLRQDQTVSSQVVLSEKIGDYAIKYAGLGQTAFKSLADWTVYLATLIRKGGTVPDTA